MLLGQSSRDEGEIAGVAVVTGEMRREDFP
jgi:hypothetical protein